MIPSVPAAVYGLNTLTAHGGSCHHQAGITLQASSQSSLSTSCDSLSAMCTFCEKKLSRRCLKDASLDEVYSFKEPKISFLSGLISPH